MPAECKNLIIEQGATFRLVLRWRNQDGSYRDLSGLSARLVIARADGSNFADLTSDDEYITLDAEGYIRVTIPAGETEDYEPVDGLQFELEVSDETEVDRLLKGPVYVIPQVPRP